MRIKRWSSYAIVITAWERATLIWSCNSGEEKVVVELKAIGGQIGSPEEQQIRNYLRLLKLNRGMLINFQQPGRKPSKTRIEIKQISL
jgi:hypothetical protein